MPKVKDNPTTKMMIDSTEAKIGLSTKKREKFTGRTSRDASGRRTRVSRIKENQIKSERD